jgi:hypothetical protein
MTKLNTGAAFVTAKAVENFLCGTDGKRGRLFLVERAARHPVRALLLELHVVLYDPDDVCLSFEVVDECLGVTHLSVFIRVNLWLIYCLNSTSVAPAPPWSGGAGRKRET